MKVGRILGLTYASSGPENRMTRELSAVLGAIDVLFVGYNHHIDDGRQRLAVCVFS